MSGGQLLLLACLLRMHAVLRTSRIVSGPELRRSPKRSEIASCHIWQLEIVTRILFGPLAPCSPFRRISSSPCAKICIAARVTTPESSS